MAKKRFGAEQQVTRLRQIEVLIGEGRSLQQALRDAGITNATYHRWRKECGGLKGKIRPSG
jgi:putative transposase